MESIMSCVSINPQRPQATNTASSRFAKIAFSLFALSSLPKPALSLPRNATEPYLRGRMDDASTVSPIEWAVPKVQNTDDLRNASQTCSEKLPLQDNRQLKSYENKGTFLSKNATLNTHEYLESANGSYRLYLQGDGNAVLRNKAMDALWSTKTHGKGPTSITLQSDGNCVMYNDQNKPVWSTGTVGSSANQLILTNEGHLLLQGNDEVVWSEPQTENHPKPSPTPQPPNSTPSKESVKIAFTGDTGASRGFQKVLNLIKSEGADLTLVAGDTSYDNDLDDDWDRMIRRTLGDKDPVLVAAGNHDYQDSRWSTVRQKGLERLQQANDVSCEGTYGEKMNCQYKNVYFVISSIGSQGSRTSHERYIDQSLNQAPEDAWRICAWHKNQHDMQVGNKGNEVGWNAYETCREHGAIIATGHEHSYSRTHLLSDMSRQRIASKTNPMELTEGKSFAFVSGLGGMSIRPQRQGGDYWASIYTSSQDADYGALFGTFYDDHADFYFKNIDNQVIDRFSVNKRYDSQKGLAPTPAPQPVQSGHQLNGQGESGALTGTKQIRFTADKDVTVLAAVIASHGSSSKRDKLPSISGMEGAYTAGNNDIGLTVSALRLNKGQSATVTLDTRGGKGAYMMDTLDGHFQIADSVSKEDGSWGLTAQETGDLYAYFGAYDDGATEDSSQSAEANGFELINGSDALVWRVSTDSRMDPDLISNEGKGRGGDKAQFLLTLKENHS